METNGHTLQNRPQSPVLVSPSPLRNVHPPHSLLAATNGHGHHAPSSDPSSLGGPSNGRIPVVPVPGAKMYEDGPSVDRGEFVRLAIQALRDCGYPDSAAKLEEESGYTFEVAPIADFRRALLGGRWDECLGYLGDVGIAGTENEANVRFCIAEQEYLELLETSQTKKALVVLRTKLAPLEFDADRLHVLSSYMLSLGPEELMQRSKWDGREGTSRQQLLAQVQGFIPAEVMIPPRRLATLFTQALHDQQHSSLYHLESDLSSSSLLADCSDHRSNFPLVPATKLDDHEDEVWNVAWSPCGRFLASAGLDKKVCIWVLKPRTEEGRLNVNVAAVATGHTERIGGLAWSPDSASLATFAENVVKIWQGPSWACVKTISKSERTICAVKWLPDGSGFWATSEEGGIQRYSREGEEIKPSVDVGPLQILDFEFTPDGKRLIGVASLGRESITGTVHLVSPERDRGMSSGVGYKANRFRLVVINVETMEHVDGDFPFMDGVVTNFRLSRDGATALVNRNPHDIQLWSVASDVPRLIRHLRGHVQSTFLIRSCFGGPVENFIVSGSEDSRIYVWHRATGELLEVLSGHSSGAVNSISWRPDVGEGRAVFASCGDDGRVILWERPVPGEPVPSRFVPAESASSLLL